jgi:hypothetical protein
MRRVRGRERSRARVRIGAPDASVTGNAGVAMLAELVERLDVVAALDAAIGPIKSRERGASAGEFLVAMGQAQLCGQEFLVGLDRCRADTVAVELSAVPIPASTTAATLAQRFTADQWLSVEDGLAQLARRALVLAPAGRRAVLTHTAPTIDLDTTDTETYGRAKVGVSYNHTGQRVGRSHLASWAETGWPLAVDLRDGRSDPRTYSAELMARALASLARIGVYRPADPDAPRPRFRADTGYMSAALAWAAVEADADFAFGVRRGTAVWTALARVPADAWRPARGMAGAEVAVSDYVPGGWPDGTACVVRRVRYDAATISADPRARRRRTIPKDQLALALDGELDTLYAYVHRHQPAGRHRRPGRRRRGLVPATHRHRRSLQGCQARRRPSAPALRRPGREPRLGLGRAAGHHALGLATGTRRPRRRPRSSPRARGPTPPRTDLRARPPGPPRPRTDHPSRARPPPRTRRRPGPTPRPADTGLTTPSTRTRHPSLPEPVELRPPGATSGPSTCR